MATKRIQLRGISRAPSDRMTEDGGCAESLNVYLDNDEIAPVVKPGMIDIGIPDGTSYEIIYIHKTSFSENYVVADSAKVGYYKDSIYDSILALENESVQSFSSVGNTLVVITDKGVKYAIFKEGKYDYLGGNIPWPSVEFQSFGKYNPNLTKYKATIDLYQFNANNPLPFESIRAFDEDLWAQAIEDRKNGVSNANTQEATNIEQEIWSAIISKASEIRKTGELVFPVLARVAVRLYDGSYIHQTVPILLGAGYDKFVEVEGHVHANGYTEMTTQYSTLTATFVNAYNAKLYMRYYNVSKWLDVIESVDVFVSTDISYPKLNSNIEEIILSGDNSNTDENNFTNAFLDFEFSFDNKGATDLAAMEKEILSKGNFYKIASFAPNELESSAVWGFDIGEAMASMPQDTLLVQERLPDYEQSFSFISLSSVYTFNNSLYAVGSQRSIADGFGALQSQNVIYQRFPDTTYELYYTAYYITSSDGKEHKVVYPSPLGEYAIDGAVSRPYGLMFHPDVRCKKAEVLNEGNLYTIEMKPHPLLNCSYGYWGLSKKILDLTPSQTDVSESAFFSGEDRLEPDGQRLYISEIDNPFYFPLSGNKTFSSGVLAVASAMTALSEGQFGQFPIYVFTEDGIWAMELDSAGHAVSVKPLSREVCASVESITAIDRSVVFLSQKGLMLLSGSEVTSLSPYMNGKHYVAESTAASLIDSIDGFSDFDEILMDQSPFLSFMKGAKIGYDYAGQRLVCINPEESYQYVFKIDTSTWHKTYYNASLIEPINSYPKLEAFAKEGNTSKLYDLSTILDSSEEQLTEKGVIATRPFDLGEPDVFKTIKDIRVRGQYKRGNVKFILLGSNDGINFYVINTLRGKSWKLFRMIILTNLEATERISWVDVEFDTRFTNRLR